jgi:hypothetical protein
MSKNIETALTNAKNTFTERPHDIELGLEQSAEADLLLRKGCRLLAALDDLASINGYYTLTIEVSFACIERSMEYYIACRNREPPTTHMGTFEMAADLGFISDEQAEEFTALWGSYRNKNYYDDGKATGPRAAAMVDLAQTVHTRAVDMTQGGAGACLCP